MTRYPDKALAGGLRTILAGEPDLREALPDPATDIAAYRSKFPGSGPNIIRLCQENDAFVKRAC